jgi:branched-chain amino acid transport system substrate-binding protein
VIVKDDGQNPATSLQDAKELVEQDKVMAIVGETSLVDSVWASYVAGKGIPVVGGIAVETPFISNPDFFPSGTQLIGQLVGMAALGRQAGKHDLGVLYCAESPVCAQLVPLAGGAAKLYGLKFYSGKIAATAPSYTAPCLAAKSAGVDALFIGDNATIVQRVVAACVQQGYKPLQVGNIGTVSKASLSSTGFDGARLSGSDASPFDASTPAIKEFQDTLNKYAPGLVSSSSFSYDAVWPWSGGKLFEAAAKAGNITPSSTPADVKKALYALKNETLAGLAPPLNFTPGKPAFVTCYFSVTVKGGNLVSLNGNKPTCLTATAAKGIAAALRKG